MRTHGGPLFCVIGRSGSLGRTTLVNEVYEFSCSLNHFNPWPIEDWQPALLHKNGAGGLACAEMHRQLALRKATVERRSEMATYVSECALLLVRVISNLCLSDDLKRRILCTFLSLMNLREILERAPSGHPLELRHPAPGLFPTHAAVPSWRNSE
jgi:hypothetical protein